MNLILIPVYNDWDSLEKLILEINTKSNLLVRVNQDDFKYIGKKMQEGWQFVDIKEVPELEQTSLVKMDGRYSGAVTRGDIALGKIPTKLFQSRSEFYRNKSDQLMDAVNSQLMRGNNSSMPISNSSKSTVTKGKQPSFQK
mgnify:CR=1 FL=1